MESTPDPTYPYGYYGYSTAVTNYPTQPYVDPHYGITHSDSVIPPPLIYHSRFSKKYETKQSGAGFMIFDYSRHYILLVQDSRSGKYSIPKGRRELFDNSPFVNAVRELYEETGYVLEKDYSKIRHEGLIDTYNIFSGIAFAYTRYFTYKPSEYISDVQWVHLSQVHKLPLNWMTRSALKLKGFILK